MKKHLNALLFIVAISILQNSNAMESQQLGFFAGLMKSLEVSTADSQKTVSSCAHALEKTQEGAQGFIGNHPYITGAVVALPILALGWYALSKRDSSDRNGRLHLSLLNTDGIKSYSFFNEGLQIPFQHIDDINKHGRFSMLQLSNIETGRLLKALANAETERKTVHTLFISGKKLFKASICPTQNSCNNLFDFYVKIKQYNPKTSQGVQEETNKISAKRLNFSLDENRAVVSWSHEGESLCTLAEHKSSVNCTSVLPLDDYNKIHLLNAFEHADRKNVRTKTKLTLQDKQVIAKIVPLRWNDEVQTRDYFMRIVEMIEPRPNKDHSSK